MKLIKKRDLIVFIVILLIIGILFLMQSINQKDGAYVVIENDGKVIETLPLDVNIKKTYHINNHYNILEIKNKKVNIIEADCDNQNCVEHSKISKNDESIICLPHKFLVRITSQDKSEMDGVAR